MKKVLSVIQLHLTTPPADPALGNAILEGEKRPSPRPSPAPLHPAGARRAHEEPKGGDHNRGLGGGGQALPAGVSVAADFPTAHRYSGARGGGPQPPGVSPAARSAGSARPGRGGHTSSPGTKRLPGSGAARPGPFPSPPLAAPLAPATHRPLRPRPGSGLRSPPSCSGRTDGCWPAGPRRLRRVPTPAPP